MVYIITFTAKDCGRLELEGVASHPAHVLFNVGIFFCAAVNCIIGTNVPLTSGKAFLLYTSCLPIFSRRIKMVREWQNRLTLGLFNFNWKLKIGPHYPDRQSEVDMGSDKTNPEKKALNVIAEDKFEKSVLLTISTPESDPGT